MYFPLKDKNDVFHIGVAVSDRPEGPFVPQSDPIKGSYSIDPAILDDGDGNQYMYFGGLWGGQLQRYRDNKALECATFPADNESAIPSRVVKLSKDMLEFAEEPKPVVILDETGKPLTAGDNSRRFFEASCSLQASVACCFALLVCSLYISNYNLFQSTFSVWHCYCLLSRSLYLYMRFTSLSKH